MKMFKKIAFVAFLVLVSVQFYNWEFVTNQGKPLTNLLAALVCSSLLFFIIWVVALSIKEEIEHFSRHDTREEA